MKTFHWQGIDSQGKTTGATAQAVNATTLSAQLKLRGITPTKIIHKGRLRAMTSKFHQRKALSERARNNFTFMLANLMHSGLALKPSLSLLSQTQSNPRLQQIIMDLIKALEQGSTFANALQQQSAYFPPLYIALVRAGEQSGQLDTLLNHIAHTQEKTLDIKRKITHALTYPLTVILVAVIICASLLIFVVPKFASLFNSFGAQLPLLTRGLISLAHGLKSNSLLLIILASVIIFAGKFYMHHSKSFKTSLQNGLLGLPVIGKTLQHGIFAQFTRLLATTLTARLPLLEALKLIQPTLKYRCFQDSVDIMIAGLNHGQSMYQCLLSTKRYPKELIAMIEMGENSGNLAGIADKLATLYAEEVDRFIDRLSRLLEPVIMLILGGLLGGMMIALYLPIFKLGSVMA